MFFHVLKNGCNVEALQLASVEKLERALAVYWIVAWRIAQLVRLGRSCPDLDVELLFELEEWQATCLLQKKSVPKKPLWLNDCRTTDRDARRLPRPQGRWRAGGQDALTRDATGRPTSLSGCDEHENPRAA